MAKRENISLSKKDGIPKITFGSSSSTDSSALIPDSYSIAGNEISAYYDTAHKLLFVIDSTIFPTKPNVMLVLNSDGARKWDDILENDFGVDLESVRPKRDNKYQNLDVEYEGLSVYNALINSFNNNADLTNDLTALREFRAMSVRRAAEKRLADATVIIDKSRDTIAKTNETISELRAKLKELRIKLAEQKDNIGRESPRTSAAKILKTESQIETATDRQKRAKRRITNAHRRLDAAMADADVARKILNMNVGANVNLPIIGAEVVIPGEHSKGKERPTIGEEIMADNNDEIKPLFDKDPNIIDEKIAFKPIEFDVSATSVGADNIRPVVSETNDNIVVTEPLSFTPPAFIETPAETVSDIGAEVVIPGEHSEGKEHPIANETSNVNSPIEQPAPTHEPLSFAPIEIPEILTEQKEITMEPETNIDIDVAPIPVDNTPIAPAPIEPVRPTPPVIQPAQPQPTGTVERPGSPISGPVVPVGNTDHNRPGVIYYIMLVLLIALSIFTLWLYQKNIPTTGTPEITTVSSPEATPKPEPAPIPPTPVPVTTLPATIDMLPSPSVFDTPPAPETVENDVMEIVETVVPVVPTPTTVDKPAYDVGGPRMGTTDTEVVFTTTPAPLPDNPVIPTGNDTYVVPDPASIIPESIRTETVVTDNDGDFYESYERYDAVHETSGGDVTTALCEDGTTPGADGCCTGETFTGMGGGAFACCTGRVNEDGNQVCFPPL